MSRRAGWLGATSDTRLDCFTVGGGAGRGARGGTAVPVTSTAGQATSANRWLLAAASAAAGIIHVSVILEHRDEAMLAVGFALAAWFQLATAFLIVRSPDSRPLLAAMAAGNVLSLVAWGLSRTTGLPFGLHDGEPEAAALLDITAAGLEAGVVVLALAALLIDRPISRQISFAGAGALLALATVAIVVPEDGAVATTAMGGGTTSSGHAHGGGDNHGGASMAAAGSVEDHAAQMLDIDRARCDLGFNPEAYWDEALATGVDTYAGGAMSQTDHGSSAITDVAGPVQLGGRGSITLDTLVGLASQSDGEAAAARLIVELAGASDAEYDAFRTWLRDGAGGGHGHSGSAEMTSSSTATSSPIQSMGHVGPSAWSAMVDPVACERLSSELDLAQETAASYPTVADALEAGYFRVTGYVPGIAAHYMNFGLVDGTFDITKPEMLLFDGTQPESKIVGLSYYVRLDGTTQPTQGFTGDNDHYHRHFGLCVSAQGVIGDSTTTDEECAARGGVKTNGTDGWMSHAWVVPGCASPWGVFSAVNPLLDGALGEATTTQEGCAGSSVRDRYDLAPGTSDLLVPPSTPELVAADD